MGGIGIFYGSSTGNTRDVSERLQEEVGGDLHNIAETDTRTIDSYEFLILATSTWGMGDLQDDWELFFPELDRMDLSGKKIAIMGLGDQTNYGDAFCDSMAILADKVAERGGKVVGATQTEGYTFAHSGALRDGKFVGLVIDEDSQSEKTLQRIKQWAATLRKEFR